MEPTRAVIFFVRDERTEGLLKPLPRRYRAAGYRGLNGRMMARLASSAIHGTDLIVATEGACGDMRLPQRGDSFGERIGNAIADAFDLGYRDVVVVGNDCPDLAQKDIEAAFRMLASGAAYVAAPTRDGGAFMIAAHRGTFDAHTFMRLPWQTDRLYQAFLELPGAASLAILREDFDDWNHRAARRALDGFFGRIHIQSRIRFSQPTLPSSSRMKALTRSFLTSPPLA